MNVTDISNEAGYPDCLEGPTNCNNEPRSTGTLHLSTIYRDIHETLAPREPIPEEDLAFYAAGGWLWERIWDLAHLDAIKRDLVIRPGEFERDGIVGSPDSLDLDKIRLIELKCRWMSSKKFDHLEKYFWYELLQIRGYLAMLGWTEAELHVMFLCGDWRPPVPCVRSVLLEFTKREVEEAWSQITSHARRRGWLK